MRESLEKLLRDNAHLAPETLVCPHIPYGKTHDEAARGLRMKKVGEAVIAVTR